MKKEIKRYKGNGICPECGGHVEMGEDPESVDGEVIFFIMCEDEHCAWDGNIAVIVNEVLG